MLGPNGSGKSTSLRSLCGLIRLDAGEIEWTGKPIAFPNRELVANCGTLIERPSLFPYLSAAKNLQLSARYLGLELSRSRTENLLQQVGLPIDRKSPVSTFSQGMKQRLGLAIALINEPALLILDEPFNGLDPIGLKTIRELLQNLSREKGTTILLSSHQLHEIEFLCDRIALMKDGRAHSTGTLDSLANNKPYKYLLECSRIEDSMTMLKEFQCKKTSEREIMLWARRESVPQLIDRLVQSDVQIYRFSPQQRLEDLFNDLSTEPMPSHEE